MEDKDEPDIIRSPEEVARRALTLFSIVGFAFGAPKSDIVEWLDETGLSAELTPSEKQFIEASPPSRQQIINAGWLAERLIVLCWALGEIAELPAPDQQCDTSLFQDILPPFAPIDPSSFIVGATLRPNDDLIAMADGILALHWEARNAKLTGSAPRTPVDIEIIQERHYAINWVIGYDGAPWDEVTADT